MDSEGVELQCYNRGCGQKYRADSNKDDSCRHHPGEPFFHDAYKGWSCCKKKCTDFTEFLNIKGCTLSKHSDVKPPEPVKPIVQEELAKDVIEVKPIIPSLKRPPIDTPMITLKPEKAQSLKQPLSIDTTTIMNNVGDSVITIGTICKNGGCGKEYSGIESDNNDCVYHPGCPVFHEGMKYWSCCNRKTSDFSAFLGQIGCSVGTHVWKKDEGDLKTIQCRWDWHQTSSHVIVSIYAKDYCPSTSIIQLNPIVNLETSQATMFGTKVEVKLKKAEPGSWSNIEVPKVTNTAHAEKPITTKKVDEITPMVDAVDLSNI